MSGYDNYDVLFAEAGEGRFHVRATFSEKVHQGEVPFPFSGGLVGRCLAAVADPRVRVGRVVFAGTPNGGTAMASPEHLGRLLDVYANVLSFFPDNGVTDALEALLAVVQDVALGLMSGLRGLTAMAPDAEALPDLGDAAAATRYFALASDYAPSDLGLAAFMAPLSAQVFLGAANDLLVPTDSVWRGPAVGPFPLGKEAIHAFGPGDGVGHDGYFGDPEAVRRILEWLSPA
jgi:hypothetical protein